MFTELATGNVIILRRRCTLLTQERQTSGFGDFKLRNEKFYRGKKGIKCTIKMLLPYM